MGEGWAADVTAHPATQPMVEEYAAWYNRHLYPAREEVLLPPIAAAPRSLVSEWVRTRATGWR